MTEPIDVLLVEDNPGDARLVREMLGDGDSGGRFRIEDAATMATALQTLAERDFQVVLLDLSLPDSQGLDTVAQIRRARPALPIVVLTGLADEEMAVRAVQGGAQDYLVKGQGDGWVIRRAIRHALERLRFEHALRSSEAELRVIFESAGIGIALAGRDGALLKINPALQRMLGSPNPERCGIQDFVAACACADTEICTTELRLVRPDLEARWVKVTVSPAHGAAQDAAVLVVMVEDFTEHRAMEERLRLSARVLESTNEGVFVTDARQRIVHVNPAFTHLTGYTADEVIGSKPSVLASGRHGPDFYASMHQILQQVGSWQGEVWNRKKSGEMFAEWLNISVVRDTDGHVTHYVAVFSDITLRKQNEERLNYQANHDPLTNLPNRTLFHERLNRALARAGRTRQNVAVLFIDLDHFKEVNDSRGHLVGDMLLQAVAERLGASTRQGDTVARLAGDEFTVILEDIADFRDAAVVAQKMVRRLSEPFELGGQRLSLTTSLGIALFPSDSTDGHSLLRKADEAMYRAKKQGKNGYQFHDETLNAQAFERLALESSLRHALDRGEFTLYYQPIHETATGRIVAAEALLRWNHPEAGLVLPAQFLGAALEAGLMLPIGRWVLNAACRQLAVWRAAGLDIRLSINLAHQQLHQFDLIETIAETLRQTGADPARLEIELAESALFGAARTQEALPVLQRLRGLGVRIAVDDFGTGYSSFGQLRRLPLDALKIDQAFVRDIGTDTDDARIITAIVAIAHSLRLGVIAEGVETSEQLAFLRRQNCELAQGFLFSRPMPIGEFDLLVSKPATVPA